MLEKSFGDAEKITVKLEEGTSLAASPSGGPTSEPAKAETSSQTPRYTLEDEVARGGMGVIFRVRDRDLSRTLAMKVMTSGSGSSSRGTDASSKLGLARFLEEAQVTAQLDHPGIVPVHEVGLDAQGQHGKASSHWKCDKGTVTEYKSQLDCRREMSVTRVS